MPDVHKILKDLEMRAVGVDPETNKMQEGYFASWRDIGLPLDEDDYRAPWSPSGGSAKANATELPPPSPDAADPETAGKTGSSTLSPESAQIVNLERSMQTYLNTFMLTDDQLVMNANYSVMPGAAKVSDAWFSIITGANGIPMDSELNDEMKAAYKEAHDYLYDEEGLQTKVFDKYDEYQEAYEDARQEWMDAYAEALINPAELQIWPMRGRRYTDAMHRAMDKWNAAGHKQEVEKALATLAAQGTDPSIALIRRAKQRWEDSLMNFAGVGDVPYVMMSPESWYKPSGKGWTQYTEEAAHHESHYESSSTSYGGGANLNLGFFSTGGSFEHSDSRKSLELSAEDLAISFEYCTVSIRRPWLDSTLLSLQNWFLMGDYKTGCISDGTMGQQQSTPHPTFFPSVVSSLILVRNLHITWSTFESDYKKIKSHTEGGGSVGFGPFAVDGHYERGSTKRDFTSDSKNQGLHVDGMQLLGYVSAINPLAPSKDSADYLKKIDAAKGEQKPDPK